VNSLHSMLESVGTANGNGASHQGLKILVAEDNMVNQHLVTRLLEKRGHVVTVACSGQEAVDCCWQSELRRDCDGRANAGHGWPRGDGADRERERGKGEHTPIIALTAYT
jgi:CheY-like chemotaxis protein